MSATAIDRVRDESGVTLVELVIAIMLLGIIIVPLTASFIFGIRATSDSTDRLSEARSPLFTSTFFAGDAESATTITTGGTPACGTGTNVISFSWTETPVPSGTPTTFRASYVVVGSGADQKLVRNWCAGASPVNAATVAPVLADVANPVTVACTDAAGAAVACAGKPARITLTGQLPKAQPFSVVATRRATV
jgi:Tfp pilus assembly protein PilW